MDLFFVIWRIPKLVLGLILNSECELHQAHWSSNASLLAVRGFCLVQWAAAAAHTNIIFCPKMSFLFFQIFEMNQPLFSSAFLLLQDSVVAVEDKGRQKLRDLIGAGKGCCDVQCDRRSFASILVLRSVTFYSFTSRSVLFILIHYMHQLFLVPFPLLLLLDSSEAVDNTAILKNLRSLWNPHGLMVSSPPKDPSHCSWYIKCISLSSFGLEGFWGQPQELSNHVGCTHALANHSPLSRRFNLSEIWLSSRCLTSVTTGTGISILTSAARKSVVVFL